MWIAFYSNWIVGWGELIFGRILVNKYRKNDIIYILLCYNL